MNYICLHAVASSCELLSKIQWCESVLCCFVILFSRGNISSSEFRKELYWLLYFCSVRSDLPVRILCLHSWAIIQKILGIGICSPAQVLSWGLYSQCCLMYALCNLTAKLKVFCEWGITILQSAYQICVSSEWKPGLCLSEEGCSLPSQLPEQEGQTRGFVILPSELTCFRLEYKVWK